MEEVEHLGAIALQRLISKIQEKMQNTSSTYERDALINVLKMINEEKQPTKKYRPFMYLDELPFNIGDVVIYRCKQCCSECKGVVTEIEYQNNDDCDLENIIIGGINVTPQELFDHYELLADDCQFKPFGIEE